MAEVPVLPDTEANPNFVDGVASHDIPVDDSLGIWVRVFVPKSLVDNSKKGPLLVFFHGGGFIVAKASTLDYHMFCSQVAKSLEAVVVSVNYRLAPENRLPTAYEDCTKVVAWLRDIANEHVSSSSFDFFTRYMDISRMIFMGDSAGGNITHHVVMSCCSMDISPLKLVCSVPIQPFFGGVSRVASEEKFGTGFGFDLKGSDSCWEMALPQGSDRDHPFCNVNLYLTMSKGLEECTGFPKSLIVVGSKDLLHDRGVEYARILEAAGKKVKLLEYDVIHGFFVTAMEPVPPERDDFLAEVIAFLSE